MAARNSKLYDAFNAAQQALTDAESEICDQESLVDDLYDAIETLMEFIGDVFPDDERWAEYKPLRDTVEALEASRDD